MARAQPYRVDSSPLALASRSRFLENLYPQSPTPIWAHALHTMAVTGRAGVMLGPLTTSWSIPSRCSVNYVNCETCIEAFRGQHCVTSGGTGPVEDDIGCWPPAASLNQATHPFLGLGFYSPGLACPTGYTTACTAEYGRRAQWDIQFSLVPGETAIGCCPEYVELSLLESCELKEPADWSQRLQVRKQGRQHMHRRPLFRHPDDRADGHVLRNAALRAP